MTRKSERISPPSERVTTNSSPSFFALLTSECSMTRTPLSLRARSSARVMSEDFPEAGNTLLPLSVTRGTPMSSKNFLVLSGGKDHTAERRNFSPRTTPSKNSRGGRSAVRLHLPLPVMKSFLPVFSFFSRSVTSAPPRASSTAAKHPEAPPPTTVTLTVSTPFRLSFQGSPHPCTARGRG